MVRTPLIQILGRRLPAPLVGRYRGDSYAFWVDAMNSVLTEIENMGTGPGLTARGIVPYEDIGISTPLPAGIAKLTQAWMSDGTMVKLIPGEGGFSVEPEYVLPETSETGASDQINLVRKASGRTWFDGNWGDVVAGDGAIMHEDGDPSSTRYTSWVIPAVASNGADESIATPGEDGEFMVPPDGAYVSIYKSYLLIEGSKALERATSTASLSPLAPKWDDLIASGLRAYGEMQTDQDSKAALLWQEKWVGAKRQFAAFGSQISSLSRKKVMTRLSMPGRL